MKKITPDQIRKLRDATGAPVMRVKNVLEELKGDEKKAEKILREEGFEKAAKRAERETKAGIIKAYVHHSNKIVSVVELFSETDFVARNELFAELAKDIALQVA
jgi:elongation factor Ts